ncbi:MAG: Spx/MgsR family RNA polymerase-binding regulatory protein [Rhizobiales bacterium]|nr:Spx/MgsR family RNA polymerase-binding regulatory protein [Hyphomicrobiales bacterium]
MMLIVYGLKNCDSCKQAMSDIKNAGLSAELHDLRDHPIAPERLRDWIDRVGIERLLNTRSTTWRGLDPSLQNRSTPQDALALLVEYPTLIKRPVIEAKAALLVGWSKKDGAAMIDQLKQALRQPG